METIRLGMAPKDQQKEANSIARHLIRLLARTEALYGFTTTCFYMRTYHNSLIDASNAYMWVENKAFESQGTGVSLA